MSDDINGIAVAEVVQLIERVERLNEEKKAISDDIRGVFAEAKSRGHDTKALRAVIRLRAKDKTQLQLEEAVLDTYRAAVGV